MSIKASEISDLIKARIDKFSSATEARNVGTVVSVTDGIVRVHGLADARYGEMLEFDGNTFGLALNLERDSVGAVVLGDYKHISEGSQVKTTGRILEVPVGPELLGRVDRGELAVGVENIELGVVLRESAAVVPFGAGGGRPARQLGALSDHQALKIRKQLFTVVRELLHHVQLVSVDHDLHQVRRGHLFLHELDGILLRPDLIELGHGGHVEEHGHQPLVFPLRIGQTLG